MNISYISPCFTWENTGGQKDATGDDALHPIIHQVATSTDSHQPMILKLFYQKAKYIRFPNTDNTIRLWLVEQSHDNYAAQWWHDQMITTPNWRTLPTHVTLNLPLQLSVSNALLAAKLLYVICFASKHLGVCCEPLLWLALAGRIDWYIINLRNVTQSLSKGCRHSTQ